MKKTPPKQSLKTLATASLALVGLTLACSVTPKTTTKEFKRFDDSNQQSVEISLPNLQRALKAAKLPAAKIVANQTLLATETNRDSQRKHLSISLGTLIREQCEVARKVYADGWKDNLSGVDCNLADGKKVFLIDDFLTPVMQATLRHTFIPEKTESSRPLTQDERKQYGISAGGEMLVSKSAETNCWSTAYEVLRRTSGASPSYTIHNLLPQEVDLRFTDPQLTQTLLSGQSASQINNQFATRGVVFGEFIIVRDKQMARETGAKSDIAHVTLLIDEGLVFERVGTDPVYPMRITTLEEVTADYPQASFDLRRLIKDFPDPKTEDFSRSIKESMEGVVYEVTIELKELKLNKSNLGRYALPESAFVAPTAKN